MQIFPSLEINNATIIESLLTFEDLAEAMLTRLKQLREEYGLTSGEDRRHHVSHKLAKAKAGARREHV
ncbi:MAG: hypothetical protein HYU02_01415 [Thaumarchaeota archaeon]|nr:hypothetical protein [Nitrososphaerota archaeon]